MSNSVKFKFGDTREGKTGIESGDFIAINKKIGHETDENVATCYGSIYKGDMILGTTEADKLVTTDSITVTGVTVGNLANGYSIPAGTPIMDILTKMLAKELTVTRSKPTAKLSGDSSKTVEKGTEISKTYTATFTDGSYTGVAGYDYSLAAGCAPTACSWGGVTGTTSKNGNTFTMIANKFTVSSTVTVNATITYDAAANTPVTNFGNAVTDNSILIGSGSVTTSNSITYTPSFKWWVGSSTTKFDDMT